MKIELFEVPGLAQYSYVVSDNGSAVVIDPIRDFEHFVDSGNLVGGAPAREPPGGGVTSFHPR